MNTTEQRLTQVWKSLNYEDYCLKGLFEATENQKSTRSEGSEKLQISFKSKIRESSFHYPSVLLWNSAPKEVTNAVSEYQAKTAIKKFVLTLPR